MKEFDHNGLLLCEFQGKFFEKSSYGKVKYSKSSLFWIGYLYRYFSYTREQSTKFVMQLFPHKQLNDVYYSFHTQNPDWCIKNLLEID